MTSRYKFDEIITKSDNARFTTFYDFQKLGFNVNFLSKFLYQFSKALNGMYWFEGLSIISDDGIAKLETYSKKLSNIFLPNSAETDGLFSDLLCKSTACCSTISAGSIDMPIFAIHLPGISSLRPKLLTASGFFTCDIRKMAEGLRLEIEPNNCQSSLMPASLQLKYTTELMLLV